MFCTADMVEDSTREGPGHASSLVVDTSLEFTFSTHPLPCSLTSEDGLGQDSVAGAA